MGILGIFYALQFQIEIIHMSAILTNLVNVLSRSDALPVVLAVAEVGHEHLEQLRLFKWKFLDALKN